MNDACYFVCNTGECGQGSRLVLSLSEAKSLAFPYIDAFNREGEWVGGLMLTEAGEYTSDF